MIQRGTEVIWVLDVKERANRPEAVWMERADEAVGRWEQGFLFADTSRTMKKTALLLTEKW